MEEGFVQAGPVRLQYFARGHGPETVVLVHGYLASARVWRLVQEALDPERFRTIALNNRGAGDSDRAMGEGDYRIETFASDLAAAVHALGLRRFALVGHSLGGATAVQYALDHPEHQDRLSALVLLNPVPLDHRTGTVPVAVTEHEKAVLAASAAAERAGAPVAFWQALDADMARVPPERVAGGRASMDGLRLRERLGELRVRVLVAGGDQDYVAGVENMLREYLALPAHLRSLHVLHGAGHSPNIGAPQEVALVLDRFLSTSAAMRGPRPRAQGTQQEGLESWRHRRRRTRESAHPTGPGRG
jgi:3-oxoadipate enol-lactonase